MRAIRLGALCVQIERVILNRKTAFSGNGILPMFDFRVVKFFDLAAINANQMIVVFAAIDLENGLAGFKEMALEQAGLFELGEHPIDRRQANIHVLGDQHAVHIFCRHVPHGTFFKQFEDFEAWECGFQPHVLEALGIAHRYFSGKGAGGRIAYFGYDIPLQSSLRNSGNRMHPSRLLFVAAFSMLMAACSYKPSFINEYKIDVQQGNVLTQEMVAQLKPGQTRDQVRFLLGTPMVADIFHQWRWDYIYRYLNGKTGQLESRRFSVFFDKDGRLERVDGDVAVATANELLTPASTLKSVDLGSLSPEAASQPLPAAEEPGFFRRMLNKIGF